MYNKKTEDCLDGHTLRRNGLPKHVIEGQLEETRGENEDVCSCWKTLRKWEGTLNWKRKHWIAVCGERVLEETVDL